MVSVRVRIRVRAGVRISNRVRGRVKLLNYSLIIALPTATSADPDTDCAVEIENYEKLSINCTGA